MRLFLYNCIIFIFLPIMVTRLFFKNLKDKDYCVNFSQRLGLLKGEYKKNPVWFHAVSLGEVISSQAIVKKLLKDEKVILSVSTPTGLREAKKIYNNQLSIVYAPWDFIFFVKNFLNKVEPKALILFETEIWPSMIHECWKKEIPVILSNGRLSESSYKKYNRFKTLIHSTLNKFSLILAQSNDHADRFKALGVNNDIVIRVGSTKFDFKQSKNSDFNRINQVDDFILAASTHEGEDEVVINSFKKLKEEFSDIKLIIVPRHPERANTIKGILSNNNMNFQVSSDLDFNIKENDIIVISATGYLDYLYKLSKVSFIGGSLFSRYGGHNIIEAAFNESPFIVGPYMKNFEDVLNLFLRRDACLQIEKPDELTDAYKKLLKNNELRKHMIDNAFKVVIENKGSSLIQYEQIKNIIN